MALMVDPWNKLTGVTVLLSPRRIHNWTIVKLPIHAMVNNPTHFTLTVAPSPRPVATSQNHQLGSKALDGPCSCWLVKHVQARAVNAVKAIKGESNRMRRDWVSKPFSERAISALKPHAMGYFTKYDCSRTHSSSHGPTAGSLQSQEYHWDCHHTHECWKEPHCHIWNTGFKVILSNVLEIEVPIETSHPSRKSQEQLCQWWMDIHEEFAFNVFRSEPTEAAITISPYALSGLDLVASLLDFIEYNTAGLVDPEESDHCCNDSEKAKQLEV